jgi:hypothetical protein
MSLARAWRRQLYGASSAALIVPSAMLGALLVLALGGGFGQVGVLGQIFAGPPAPSVEAGAPLGGRGGAGPTSLPAILVTAGRAASPRPATRHAGMGTASGRGGVGVVPVSSRGPAQTGGSIGGAAPVVSKPLPVVSKPVSAPPAPAPAGSTPSGPTPSPKPQPTPVNQIVNTVTPVTSQLPAPAGPAVTQAVQAAGSAADSVLPPVKLP